MCSESGLHGIGSALKKAPDETRSGQNECLSQETKCLLALLTLLTGTDFSLVGDNERAIVWGLLNVRFPQALTAALKVIVSTSALPCNIDEQPQNLLPLPTLRTSADHRVECYYCVGLQLAQRQCTKTTQSSPTRHLSRTH